MYWFHKFVRDLGDVHWSNLVMTRKHRNIYNYQYIYIYIHIFLFTHIYIYIYTCGMYYTYMICIYVCIWWPPQNNNRTNWGISSVALDVWVPLEVLGGKTVFFRPFVEISWAFSMSLEKQVFEFLLLRKCSRTLLEMFRNYSIMESKLTNWKLTPLWRTWVSIIYVSGKDRFSVFGFVCQNVSGNMSITTNLMTQNIKIGDQSQSLHYYKENLQGLYLPILPHIHPVCYRQGWYK